MIYSRSLLSLTNNIAEGLHEDKCKDCQSYLEYMKVNIPTITKMLKKNLM